MLGSCVNGRVNPSAETKLRLFADSAGHCNKPDCHRYLFSDQNVADYHIGEMAHIVAASIVGPRANKDVDPEERAEYNNLILLCPSCHTEIDKAPEVFSIELIQDWKANHKTRIVDAIGIPTFDNRNEARNYVAKILRTNEVIFDKLNPDLSYRENPEAEEAVVWKRKMVSQIIPNNQKILLFSEINIHLLDEEELITLEYFRQHVDDLIERHLGNNLGKAGRFPIKMNDILKH
jgi:triacylglycerol esterase/lipase EstA (alpha/beta hydrolase family)